jgi:uncharacterized protein (TIRG00374 family)
VKLAINFALSFGMLALCLWLVWPDTDERMHLARVVAAMQWRDFAPYLAGYLGLQAVVHLCRSLRWNNLLAPLGVRVPLGPLLAISSVGFMMILALPARLGELVRPGLMHTRGYTTATSALGLVAVERIIDGLIISLLVFVCFFALRGAGEPAWMMPVAYSALGIFSAALVFMVFALWRSDATVRFCVALTLLPRLAPGFAEALSHRLHEMIRGLWVLRDRRNLLIFLAWSVVYWGANGAGVWLLARGFGLELSPVGAVATMGLVGVGISLPNSPGMVGQFQYFTLLGLSLYLGFDPNQPTVNADVYTAALAFAIAQHLLQLSWYVVMGAVGLATPWVSFHDLRIARKLAPETADGDAPGDVSPRP